MNSGGNFWFCLDLKRGREEMKAKEAQGHFKNSNLTCLPFTFEVSLSLSPSLSLSLSLSLYLSIFLIYSLRLVKSSPTLPLSPWTYLDDKTSFSNNRFIGHHVLDVKLIVLQVAILNQSLISLSSDCLN